MILHIMYLNCPIWSITTFICSTYNINCDQHSHSHYQVFRVNNHRKMVGNLPVISVNIHGSLCFVALFDTLKVGGIVLTFGSTSMISIIRFVSIFSNKFCTEKSLVFFTQCIKSLLCQWLLPCKLFSIVEYRCDGISHIKFQDKSAFKDL